MVAGRSYGPTSAPAIWNNTIMIGVSCDEGPGVAAPGDVALLMCAAAAESGGSTLSAFRRIRKRYLGRRFVEESRRVECLGRYSVDIERGIVSPVYDRFISFYGGDRRGDNLLANCRTHSMRRRASESGILRRYVVTCGIVIAGLSEPGHGRPGRLAN